MRELLEQADRNREDGFARARRLQKRELPRRFYKEVSVGEMAAGFAVLLDGRRLRTPGKAEVVVPARALAEKLASEWRAQAERVDPATMPLMRLVNTAVEGGTAAAPALCEEVVRYAGSDLLLYRADAPAELAARQAEIWGAALAQFGGRFGIEFAPTAGIVHRAQPPESLEKVASLAAAFGPLALTALVSATGLTGSAILALGVAHSLFERDFAWEAAHLDEDHNISQWGEDAEAAARRAFRRAEFDAAIDVIETVGIAG